MTLPNLRSLSLAALLALTLTSFRLSAQEPSDTGEPAPSASEPQSVVRGVRLGPRAGAFEMINSPDSYEAVFNAVMPQLGLAVEVELPHRVLLTVAYDFGEVDGEQVLPGRPIRRTGEPETLTYEPLSLTAAWLLPSRSRWEAYLGGGVTYLNWRDVGARTTSGGDLGAHAVFGFRRGVGAWRLGAELRYSTVPNAVGDSGISRVFEEDDLGGLSLHFVGLYDVRRR